MKKSKYLSFILIFIFLISMPFSLHANYKGNDKDKGKKPLQKTNVNPSQSLININNISCWVSEEGFHDWVVASGWNGAFPSGTTVGAIFAEGLVWGGKVNDGSTPLVRVNGNTYGTGCSPITRLYRVRPDFLTGNLLQDAATFNNVSTGAVTAADIQALRDQYQIDWNQWPVNEGAPYKDIDQNGTYNPEIDIPGIPGASQTLFIKYNDAISASNYGSPPIGLEVSETYWAYSYTGALGNVIYKKVDLVYKGTPTSAANSSIDSMYIVQWADPDVGASGDDFGGCDTALNLGYAYNSGTPDATYDGLGLAPPAAGYDFLQGVSTYTGNPNDSAMFNLKWRKGYKYINPKPMSSYAYFAAGGTWGDPDFEYNGTLEFYNLMRGYLPIPRYPNSTPFPESVADVTSFGTYLLSGNPVDGTGKLDGAVDGPGDRRIMVTNGPITMHLGDTAQVVVALVAGIGTDHLSSVTNMKKNDETAQIVFDQLFQLPSIDPPVVQIANLDQKLVLNWGNDAISIDKIENFADKDYTFEGYEVYQIPSPSSSLSEGVLLGTFDVVNGVTAIYDTVLDVNGTSIPQLSADGKDAGVQRYLNIENDKINGTDLRNGQEYYFAVVSYAYNPAPLLPFHALRSAFVIQTAIPQTAPPGTVYNGTVGDTLAVVHTGGSDGDAIAIVVDPTALTGHTYEVKFDTAGGNTTWSIIDKTLNTTVVSGLTNQAGGETYPIVDGIMVKVTGPQPDFKDFQEVSNANGPHDPSYAAFRFNGSGFPTTLAGDPDRPDANPSGTRWGIHTGANGSGSFDYTFFKSRVLRGSNGTRLIPYDYELRFTAAGGKAYLAFTNEANVDVPFEIWNIGIATPNDPSDDYRMIPWVLDNLENNVFDLSGSDCPISGGDNDAETDWIYWYQPVNKSAGTAGYDSYVNNLASGDTTAALDAIGDEVMARMVLVNFNGGSVSDPNFPNNFTEQIPPTGSVYRLISTKPNDVNDSFTFNAPTVEQSMAKAKTDVEKINVFPNPYYGYHYRETSPTNHYVTFSHLPDNATIRVFDISGVLVKTITHESTKGQFDSWDLQNDNNYPVASGIYIVHVDMPELGTTKILKLAVIQEQQMLKVY